MKQGIGKQSNILLTSVGRRSYLVKYFKEALGKDGEVHVSNSNAITPSFIYADKSVVTPLIYENGYIPFLLNYCVKNQITAIISLFDVDLPILSANRQSFEDIGVRVIVSDEDVINVCNDKWETYNFLIGNGFNAPKTYVSIESALEAIRTEEIQFPVMLKPRWGMGSIAVFEIENEHELEVLYNKVISNIMASYLKYESQVNLSKCVVIQEKLRGQEYGLDVINNLDGKYQNTIVKKKYAMRSGETDCAETINSPELKALGKAISEKLHHVANLDMDVFVDDDKPFVLEMNARFGGGYPFSHIAGVNLPLAIVKWLRSEEVDVCLLTERAGILAHKDIEIVNAIK
jgi:carbamoyl-phosphate synthase large subunit